MIKLTPEEQEYWDKKYNEFVREKIREAEEEDEWLTEEEAEEDIRKFDEQLRRANLLKRTELNIQNNTREIEKRFIRA